MSEDPYHHFSAITPAKDNAELVVLARRLGHLPDSARVVDVTYGGGVWWKLYRPDNFVTNDLGKGHPLLRFDFCHAPFSDRSFDIVVYDPPYKLNGTPDPEIDERYGVEIPTRWQDRMKLIEDGFIESCRISDFKVLAKVQDQVCSGQIRWQTIMLHNAAQKLGFRLVDELHLTGGRKQGKDVSQLHARHDFSTLMVFQRTGRRKKR